MTAAEILNYITGLQNYMNVCGHVLELSERKGIEREIAFWEHLELGYEKQTIRKSNFK